MAVSDLTISASSEQSSINVASLCTKKSVRGGFASPAMDIMTDGAYGLGQKKGRRLH